MAKVPHEFQRLDSAEGVEILSIPWTRFLEVGSEARLEF